MLAIINIAKTVEIMENHLFNMHHKIKLKLDAICQEEGDMNVEEFMQVYESLKYATLEHDNIELKNANKLAHERIKKLKEVFRATHKSKYKLIKELEEEKIRVKELEDQVQSMLDDKPSFVKNLWSRNPQKINGKYPSIK